MILFAQRLRLPLLLLAGLFLAPALQAQPVGATLFTPGGGVMLAQPGSGWTALPPEMPQDGFLIGQGSSVWTDASSSAVLGIGAVRLDLAGGTEITLAEMDLSQLQIQFDRGFVSLTLYSPPPGGLRLSTALGWLDVLQPGQYDLELDVDPQTGAPQRLLITVLSGLARLTTVQGTAMLAGGQAATALPVGLIALVPMQPVPDPGLWFWFGHVHREWDWHHGREFEHREEPPEQRWHREEPGAQGGARPGGEFVRPGVEGGEHHEGGYRPQSPNTRPAQTQPPAPQVAPQAPQIAPQPVRPQAVPVPQPQPPNSYPGNQPHPIWNPQQPQIPQAHPQSGGGQPRCPNGTQPGSQNCR